MDNELKKLRGEIDAVDAQIIAALAERTALVEEVGRYKSAHNIEALDADRRDALLGSWIERGVALGLSKEFMTALNEVVHDYSVDVEKRVR